MLRITFQTLTFLRLCDSLEPLILKSNLYILVSGSNWYQPAASVSLHVAETLKWFGAVVVKVKRVYATLLIAILHDLGAVHREGVHEAN